jgi:hypothetical protein
MKKLISVLISVIFMFSAYGCATPLGDKLEDELKNVIDNVANDLGGVNLSDLSASDIKGWIGVLQNSEIIDQIREGEINAETARHLLDAASLKGVYEQVFPDSYLGNYINEKEELVVQVTSLDPSVIKTYVDLFGAQAPVIFEEIGDAYRDLKEVRDTVLKAVGVLQLPIFAYYIDRQLNRFKIEIAQPFGMKADVEALLRDFTASPVDFIVRKTVSYDGDVLPSAYEPAETPAGIGMAIKSGSITPSGLTLILTNGTDREQTFWFGYRVQYLFNGEWHDVEATLHATVPSAGLVLGPNESRENDVYWERYGGKFPHGTYRLIKYFTADSDLVVEFEIAE